jgi:hypothetical protein
VRSDLSADRLKDVLERCRADLAPDLDAGVLSDVADIALRNQFDDDRVGARKEIREVVEHAAKAD